MDSYQFQDPGDFCIPETFSGRSATDSPHPFFYAHLGTVIAAILYFRRELSDIILEIFSKPLDFRYHLNGKAGFLFVSLLCTGIIGIPLLIAEKGLLSTLDAGLL
jgi:undecaprenyl pyrophosphate phosphatase UppP